MTTTVRATFTSRRFSDGTTQLTCRETGTVYSFNDMRHPLDSFPVWRGNDIACYRRGRAPALGFIESDSKWQIREEQRAERAAAKGRPSGYSCIWL